MEVDVRIDRDPATIRWRRGRLEGQHERGASCADLQGLPEWAPIEPMDDLDIDGPDRQESIGIARARRRRWRLRARGRRGVLVEADVDLVAVPERRQITTVRRPEPDPRRHRLAGRRVDDLDIHAPRRRRQRLDGDRPETASSALAGQPAGGTRSSPIASVASGANASRRRPRTSALVGSSLPQPTTESDGGGGAARRRRRARAEHLAEVDTDAGRVDMRADPQGPPRLDRQGRRRPGRR
jgi:hypothetical protein